MKLFLKTVTMQKMAAVLVGTYVKLLLKTCKVHIKGAEQLQPYIDAERAMLPCYWHQQMTFAIQFMLGLCQQGVKVRVLVSPSKDGDIGDAVLQQLGVGVLRGSAHRTGALALRDIYLTISKEKCSVGAAVDGPLGPAREAKVGAITLAQLSGAPIIPITNACSHKIQFNSWDSFFLPLPFSTVNILIGEPIVVEKRVSAEQIAEFQQQLTDQLNQLSLQSEQLLN
ncbi:lysophospholipid acyltransferase family protein [Methyloprofundus sp.]|uniref:lysophospholipid acyltransferase family protein n=1 Tax=Methyloprofundus sp. TaxID=2020875 RepID=UPI003D0D12DB